MALKLDWNPSRAPSGMSWPMADQVDRVDMAERLSGRLLLDDDVPAALVYDLAQLEARALSLKATLPEFQHCLALKAAPYAALLQRFGAWGFGFEAASLPEGLVAQQACPDAVILFDSPAKTRTEIAQAEARGWIISANSLAELSRVSAPCSLRVNTKTGAGSIQHTSVADAHSRFGEPYDDLPADLACEGWHAHIGSQGCSLAQLVLSARRLADVALRHPQTRWINLGGGIPAQGSYETYANALREAVPELFDGRWTVYTEMGRSLLAESARAYSRVEYATNGVATIHLGADFLLRRVYRPEDWYYPMRALSPDLRPLQGAAHQQSIAGPLCFAGDVLGGLSAPLIAEGDVIEIDMVGAYSASMWSRHCSRRMPPVFGLTGSGEMVVISHGETDADILHLWRGPTRA
jgi:diaminopimelate decarboxylase